MAKSEDYQERKVANEASLAKAEHHQEPWLMEEVLFLEENWVNGDEDTLVVLAEILGRTIEACRQKHYEIGKKMIARAKRAEQAVDLWTRGFTSIREMEEHYGEN